MTAKLLVRNWPPIHGGQGRSSHFTLGGGRFNKQGNSHTTRLVLVGCETSRSLHPPECVTQSLSRVCSVTSWIVACSTPLSMEFSSKNTWSGLPFHSPGDLPGPRIEPASLASPALVGGSFTTEPPGKSTPICQNLEKKFI